MTAKEKIEKYFGMNFEKILTKLHWESGLSLFELSIRCGISRDVMYKNAKRLGLKTMNRTESAISRKRHHKHWATGLNKENSEWARRSSDRLKENNPIKYKNAALKRAKTMSNVFSKKLWPQEIKFKAILDKHLVEYEMQKPIGPYNIDFFVSQLQLCIEIDSTSKWGKDRRIAATKKDEFLTKKGFKILRINKNNLSDTSFINNVLQANNVI